MISETEAAIGVFFAILIGLASLKLLALPWLLRRRSYLHRPIARRSHE